MKRHALILPAVLTGSLVLSACGSPATIATSTSTTTSTPSLTGGATRNLVVTPSVRKSLLDAAAAYHQLPPSDYVGLNPGATYYAFDPTTNHYYAAAGLQPSPHSLSAQVGTQDDGAYNLFTRAASSQSWTVFNDGLGGVQGSKCPLVIPSAVVKVWNWKAGTCYPPHQGG
ncbi:MAG TPA: hypothetical protein VGZ04_02085 [Acidimicrobiales bacterium]|jgi:hypothetical protein|nr:hypothetical protein [Acidimicrobiales bacterium]